MVRSVSPTPAVMRRKRIVPICRIEPMMSLWKSILQTIQGIFNAIERIYLNPDDGITASIVRWAAVSTTLCAKPTPGRQVSVCSPAPKS